MSNVLYKVKFIMDNSIKNKSMEFSKAASTLEALSPLKVLSRGYSYVEGKEGRLVSSVRNVKIGDMLYITLKDGKVTANVKDKVNFYGEKN